MRDDQRSCSADQEKKGGAREDQELVQPCGFGPGGASMDHPGDSVEAGSKASEMTIRKGAMRTMASRAPFAQRVQWAQDGLLLLDGFPPSSEWQMTPIVSAEAICTSSDNADGALRVCAICTSASCATNKNATTLPTSVRKRAWRV